MKKIGVIIILIISLFVFLGNIHSEKIKISSETESILKNGESRVIIKFNENYDKKISIFSEKTNKQKIKEQIGENKIKYDFGDKISARISYEDLENLDLKSIKEITIEPTRKIFLQESVPLINATNNWKIQYSKVNLTGVGETICIIDTGVNYSHPALGGCYGNNNVSSSCKIIGGIDLCADNFNCTNIDDDPMDVQGHGTHVSGIAAGSGDIFGVAPDSKIVMIKASNGTGTFWDSEIIKGINWCVDNSSLFNISVISMSLGGDTLYDSYCDSVPAERNLANAINNAVSKNISVIVASGNGWSTTQIASPACVRNATAVGSSVKADNSISSFSNRNSITDLVAPGGNSFISGAINSTCIPGDEFYSEGYCIKQGTSMATPHVAGAFALIHQLIKKQENRNASPVEIQNALNITGKRIYDSGSGLNYSRINILNATIYLDNKAPIITPISPEGSISQNSTQVFYFNFSDEVGLKNYTFYLWNSSSYLINTTSKNISGFKNNSNIELTNLENKTYIWAVESYDLRENRNISRNISFSIEKIVVNLKYPENNSYFNKQEISFNCSGEVSEENEIVNITLQIWNSSRELIYNITNVSSGRVNNSINNYNFSEEGNYVWACKIFDSLNQSEVSENKSFSIDLNNPSLNLISPSNGYSSSSSINLEYSVTDNFGLDNCSIKVDGENYTNKKIINGTNSLTQSYSVGNHIWSVTCYDLAGNLNSSENRTFSVTNPPSSSGGGGGGIITPSTYIPKKEEIQEGYKTKLKEKDKIKFQIKSQNHSLTLEKTYKNFSTIIINSTPVILNISIGEIRKIDLDEDKIFDLEISCLSILDSKTEIKIKSIQEPVPTRQIFNEPPVKEFNESLEKNEKEGIDTRNPKEQISNIIYILIILIMIVIILLVWELNKPKNKK